MLLALLLFAAADIQTATLSEAGAKTPEISTAELREILKDRSATVLDTRPRAEYTRIVVFGDPAGDARFVAEQIRARGLPQRGVLRRELARIRGGDALRKTIESAAP